MCGSPEPVPESKTPSRVVAIVLSVVGPLGVGQLYLGQTKRAWRWLAGSALGFVLLTFSLPPLGALLGYGKVLAIVLGCGLACWIAAVFDVIAIAETRAKRVRWSAILGFWIAAWVVWLAVSAVTRRYAVEAFKTPSGSMQPTLLVGEHIMAAKGRFLSLPPKRGEAIIFKSPENPELPYVKRVIGLPGDSLELKSGHPWLNGWEVPHCRVGKTTLPDARPGCAGTLELEFLEGAAYPVFFDECSDEGKQGPYHVTAGELWVLGDNRNNSFDSRAWFGGRGGGVPLGNVTGRALFRWFSPTDWSRYGTAIVEPLLPKSMAALAAEFEKCLAARPAREKTLPPAP